MDSLTPSAAQICCLFSSPDVLVGFLPVVLSSAATISAMWRISTSLMFMAYSWPPHQRHARYHRKWGSPARRCLARRRHS